MAMAVSLVGCGDSAQNKTEAVPVPEQIKSANNAMEDFMKNKQQSKK